VCRPCERGTWDPGVLYDDLQPQGCIGLVWFGQVLLRVRGLFDALSPFHTSLGSGIVVSADCVWYPETSSSRCDAGLRVFSALLGGSTSSRHPGCLPCTMKLLVPFGVGALSATSCNSQMECRVRLSCSRSVPWDFLWAAL
jgi:hypothetical protein